MSQNNSNLQFKREEKASKTIQNKVFSMQSSNFDTNHMKPFGDLSSIAQGIVIDSDHLPPTVHDPQTLKNFAEMLNQPNMFLPRNDLKQQAFTGASGKTCSFGEQQSSAANSMRNGKKSIPRPDKAFNKTQPRASKRLIEQQNKTATVNMIAGLTQKNIEKFLRIQMAKDKDQTVPATIEQFEKHLTSMQAGQLQQQLDPEDQQYLSNKQKKGQKTKSAQNGRPQTTALLLNLDQLQKPKKKSENESKSTKEWENFAAKNRRQEVGRRTAQLRNVKQTTGLVTQMQAQEAAQTIMARQKSTDGMNRRAATSMMKTNTSVQRSVMQTALSRESELIVGRRVQNHSKLQKNTNEDVFKRQSQLRQSEKLLQNENILLNQDKVSRATYLQTTKQSLSPMRSTLEQASKTAFTRKRPAIQHPSGKRFNQREQMKNMTTTQRQNLKVMQQQRRPKSGNLANRPPMPASLRNSGSILKPQIDIREQFQEYLDSNLQQNSIHSSVPCQTQVLTQTTLNILSGQQSILPKANMMAAKKQQKMLSQQVQEGQRSGRAHSAVATKQGKTLHQNSVEVVRNAAQQLIASKRATTILERTTRQSKHTPIKLIQSHNRSQSSSSSHLPRGQSSEKGRGRKTGTNSEGNRPVAKSTSGRRTVECLLADQLRNERANMNQTDANFESNTHLNATNLEHGISYAASAEEVQNEYHMMNKNKNKQTLQFSATQLADYNLTSSFNQQQKIKRTQYIQPKQKVVQPPAITSQMNLTTLASAKVDKMIKQNLRRHKAQIEESRAKLQEKVEQTKLKQQRIVEQNDRVRKLNKEIVARQRKLKNDKSEFDFQQSVDEVMAKTEKIEKIKDRPKTSLKVDLLENRSATAHEDDLDMSRFKNHRRSNFGMDFIDIRKEIMAEMKSTNMIDAGRIKLKQSLSQRNVQQMKTKNLAASVGGGFLRNISTQADPKNKFNEVLTRSIKNKQLNCTHQQESPQHQQGVNEPLMIKKEKIQKFIKKQRKQAAIQRDKMKNQEIATAMQVKENLIKLNKFIVKNAPKQTPVGTTLQTSTIQPPSNNQTFKLETTQIKKGRIQFDKEQRKNLNVKQNIAAGRKKNAQILKVLHHQLARQPRLRPKVALRQVKEDSLVIQRQLKTRNYGDVEQIQQQEQTPGKQLLYENSEHSFLRRSHDSKSHSFPRSGGDVLNQRRTQLSSGGGTQTNKDLPHDCLYEESKSLHTMTAVQPLRKVLHPNVQNSSSGMTTIVRSSTLKSQKKDEKHLAPVVPSQPSYFENSSQGSSKRRQLTRSPIHNPQQNLQYDSNSSIHSPRRKTSTHSKRTGKNNSASFTRVTAPLRTSSLTKSHLRSTSHDGQVSLQPKMLRQGEYAEPPFSPQSDDFYVYEKVAAKKQRVKLSVEGACVKIQRAHRVKLARRGFYERPSLQSPDRQPTINLYVDHEIAESSVKHSSVAPPKTINTESAFSLVQKTQIDNELSLDKEVLTPEDSQKKQTGVFNLTESTPPKENPEQQESDKYLSESEEESQQISLKQKAFAEQKEQQSSQHQAKSAQTLLKEKKTPMQLQSEVQDNTNQYHMIGSQTPQSNSASLMRNQPFTRQNPLLPAQNQTNPSTLMNRKGRNHVLEISSQNSENFGGEMLLQPSQYSAGDQSSSVNEPPALPMNFGLNLQHHGQSHQSVESFSQKSSNSLFDRNAFGNLSRQKLIQLMQNNEYQQLIKFREEWLMFREKKEKRAIKKLFTSKQVSPRSYQQKKDKIDRWVTVQKEDIQKTKMVYQQEWDKTVQMIEETQKNVDQTRQKIGISDKKEHYNTTDKSEAISSQPQYYSRSVLIEDPPKSYRSGRQEVASVPILPLPVIDGKSEEAVIAGDNILSTSHRSGTQTDKIINKQSNKNEMFFGDDQEEEDQDQVEKILSRPQLLSQLFRDRSSNETSHSALSTVQVALMADNYEQERAPNTGASEKNEPSQELLERLEKCFPSQEDQQIDKLGNDQVVSLQELDALLDAQEEPKISEEALDVRDSVLIINDDEFVQIEGFNMNDFNKRQQVREQDIRKLQQHNERVEMKVVQKDQHQSALDKIITQVEQEPHFFLPSQPEESHKESNVPLDLNCSSAKLEPKLSQISTPDSTPPVTNEPAIISGQSEVNAEKSNLIQVVIQKPRKTVVPDSGADVLELMKSDSEREDLSDQITEAIFKDILKELYWGFPPERKLEEVEKKKEQKAEPQDVYVIDGSISQKEERREWIEAHHRHMIERELFQSDTYMNEVLERMLMYEIDTEESSEEQDSSRQQFPLTQFKKHSPQNLHIQFLQALTQPILRSSLQVLCSQQQQESGTYMHFETTFNMQKFPIIPVDLYLEVERQRDEEEQAERNRLKDQLNSSQELSIVQESVHIQNKCYFDALNESLMKFRPYGITGEPMPWSTKIRRLQTKVDINSVDTERLFQMVKHDVFRWSSAFCGSLPSQDYILPDSKKKKKDSFNDELFQETRDKRLSQVLQAETIEQEHHWLNFEFEEAQIKLDLSDMVLDQLIEEMAGFLRTKEPGYVPGEVPISEMKTEQPYKRDDLSRKDSMFGDLQRYQSVQEQILKVADLSGAVIVKEDTAKSATKFASHNKTMSS